MPDATLSEVGQLDEGSDSLGLSPWGSTRCPSVGSQLSVSKVSCWDRLDSVPLWLEEFLDILFSSGLLPLRNTSLCSHLVRSSPPHGATFGGFGHNEVMGVSPAGSTGPSLAPGDTMFAVGAKRGCLVATLDGSVFSFVSYVYRRLSGGSGHIAVSLWLHRGRGGLGPRSPLLAADSRPEASGASMEGC